MKKIYFTTGVLAALLLSSLTTFAQSQPAKSREDLLKELEAKRKELAALELSFLAPAEEDRSRYADFLRTPNTGLIRILPREKYDNNVLRYNTTNAMNRANPASVSRKQLADLPQGQQVTEETSVRRDDDVSRVDLATQTYANKLGLGLTIRGGGAYYSFTLKTHEYGGGSDLELQRGELSTGFAGANYGLMARLGDVPLETVGLALPEVNALVTYKPASELPQARIEQRRFNENTEIDGLKVKRRQSLRAGSTYLLRSLNYGSSDVLVAFKVVRVDSDGSAIILWKLLKEFPIPQLARN